MEPRLRWRAPWRSLRPMRKSAWPTKAVRRLYKRCSTATTWPPPANLRPAFKDERVTVTSIENTHYPERSKAKMPYRSLAYRFESKTRSIVFSGDTAYSRNVVELAQGADVFICEVLDQAIHDQVAAQAKAAAEAGNPNNIFRHVADTHSTPADVGRMAAEAKVKLVVLNHLVPGTVASGRPDFPVTSFADAVRTVYSGEVMVGQDLMVI